MNIFRYLLFFVAGVCIGCGSRGGFTSLTMKGKPIALVPGDRARYEFTVGASDYDLKPLVGSHVAVSVECDSNILADPAEQSIVLGKDGKADGSFYIQAKEGTVAGEYGFSISAKFDRGQAKLPRVTFPVHAK